MREPIVKITKTRAKQPFRLQEYAANGEPTGPSENYAAKQSIRKLLLFRLKLYNGISVLVVDATRPGTRRVFRLFKNNRVIEISKP